MGRHDWYRNKQWNSEIEAAFFKKLKRARDIRQYLCCQATYLIDTHPQVALQLLDMYFDSGGNFEIAVAWTIKAKAHSALGQMSAAVAAYQAALAREATHPSCKTLAYLELPYLVAMHGLRNLYSESMFLLESCISRPLFPFQQFLWSGSYALILYDTNNLSEAKMQAKKALEAATKTHSGFRYHPTIGLVGEEYPRMRERLNKLISA